MTLMHFFHKNHYEKIMSVATNLSSSNLVLLDILNFKFNFIKHFLVASLKVTTYIVFFSFLIVNL
jgi:hypothetical protein